MKPLLRNITPLTLGLALAISAGTAGATSYIATANGPGGSHDKWNNAANWDAGIPSGADSAIITGGLTAEVFGSPANNTPAYSGGLNLGVGSTLQIGWTTNYSTDWNALGTGAITMNDGSSIRLRMPAQADINALVMAGNGSIHLSPSTSAHHQTRTFSNAISGAGGLTLAGNNNNTGIISSTNTFAGGFIGNADDSWRIDANAAGAFGLGDVTLNGRSGVPSRGVSLRINALGGGDTIADTAALHLNGGRDHRLAAKLILGADETVGAFFIDGVDQGVGTWTSASGLLTSNGDPLISGNGTLTVLAVVAIPEPSTIALLGLGGLGLILRRRK